MRHSAIGILLLSQNQPTFILTSKWLGIFIEGFGTVGKFKIPKDLAKALARREGFDPSVSVTVYEILIGFSSAANQHCLPSSIGGGEVASRWLSGAFRSSSLGVKSSIKGFWLTADFLPFAPVVSIIPAVDILCCASSHVVKVSKCLIETECDEPLFLVTGHRTCGRFQHSGLKLVAKGLNSSIQQFIISSMATTNSPAEARKESLISMKMEKKEWEIDEHERLIGGTKNEEKKVAASIHKLLYWVAFDIYQLIISFTPNLYLRTKSLRPQSPIPFSVTTNSSPNYHLLFYIKTFGTFSGFVIGEDF
ncbi:hypothetical protein V8G54_020535 [Vigna mungo]|uniref:Uncharacterized protein n=1 Tax=Vigna mungo TaxID=3915 RepID=A0AAQ3RWH5_VIGMU